jgi:AraC-like DNA-binding protein/mannose-6-phosphate isomerase-like protein (cupin superfamily)
MLVFGTFFNRLNPGLERVLFGDGAGIMAIEVRGWADRPGWLRPELPNSLVPISTDLIRNTPRPLLNCSLGQYGLGETRPHSHPCLAIHGCLQGNGTEISEEETVSLRPGVFCLFPAGARHVTRVDVDRTTAITVLIDTENPGRWPRESGVTECCRELQRLVRRFETFNTATNSDLAHVFWQVADRMSNDGPCSTAATVGFLWALLGQIVERLNGVTPDLPAADAARGARRYLAARLHDQITVAEVAHAVHMSPTRLLEVFSAAYGCGIIRYFNQLKVKEAQRLLAGSTLTVDQVSRTLSFSSPTYFSRVFIRYTGQTPSEFRASR